MAPGLRSESPSIRWVVRYVVATFLYYSGILSVYRALRERLGKGRLLILAYHSVSDFPNYLDMFMGVSKFSSQIRYLKDNYRIIGIGAAVDLVASQDTFHQDQVVITFDDGYQDNFDVAYPILREHGVPATIFLTTQNVDSGMPTFVFSVALLLENTGKGFLDLRAHGLNQYRLDSLEAKERTLAEIDGYSKKLSDGERKELLGVLAELLGPFPEYTNLFRKRMLTWSEAKEMSDNGVTFGTHTENHPLLSSLTAEEIAKEIEQSKKTIEGMIGKPVLFFAYPYGDRKSYNAAAVKAAEKSGLMAAFVLFRNDMNYENLYSLGRVMVSNGMTSNPFNGFSKAMFACEVSGLMDLVFRRA